MFDILTIRETNVIVAYETKGLSSKYLFHFRLH